MCFFFQQKLRESLFSLSLSFLLEKVGGEGEKKLEKKKPNSFFKSRRGVLLRKNLQHNIPLTQASPPIRWEGCVPARRGLGDKPVAFL